MTQEERIRLRTCLHCGWVHFAVSRAYAETEVARFNAFFDKASPATQAAYRNRRSSVQSYEHCMRRNAQWTEFRDALPEDCPVGCTLNPIIYEHIQGGGLNI